MSKLGKKLIAAAKEGVRDVAAGNYRLYVPEPVAAEITRQHLADSAKVFAADGKREPDYKKGMAAFKWMLAFYGKP